jgi:hypothetical protein
VTTLRWVNVRAQSPPTLRWAKVSASGAVKLQPKFRWVKLQAAGPVDILLRNIAAQAAIEPWSGQTRTTISFSTGLLKGPIDQSGITWTWRQISGPTVTLTPSGSSVSFPAPLVMPGASLVVVLGVTATLGSSVSPEVTASATVNPQVTWSWTGTQWVGAPL